MSHKGVSAVGQVGDSYAFHRADATDGNGSGVPLDPASFEDKGFALSGEGNGLGFAKGQDPEGEQ